MNEFTAKAAGRLMLLAGIVGLIAVVCLLLMFVGLALDVRSLILMGPVNDALNSLASVLIALLASVLYPSLRRLLPGASPILVASVWIGAAAHTLGSWLIMSGRSDVERSSYFYFVGNGLIGIWVWALSYAARRQASWPHGLTRLGLIAGSFMLGGLLGLYGMLSGADGAEYSPLVTVAGVSFAGMGILFPIWCLRGWRWIGAQRHDGAVGARGAYPLRHS